jgi:hypothetical protein
MSVMAMSTQVAAAKEYTVLFDTDAKQIGVENRCIACISHDISDFITALTKCNRTIKSFGGGCTVNVLQGTIRWRWCDDCGKRFIFTIPNSYYIPSGKCQLLSPQHWTRRQKDRKPIEGTGETINSKETVLYWGQRKHRLAIPLTKTTNVASFYLAPGYSKFQAFCAEAKLAKHDECENIVDSTIICDDKDDEELVKKTGSDSMHWKPSNEPVPCGFGIDDTPRQGESSTQGWSGSHKNPTKKNFTMELPKYHQRMGHISFAKLQLIAKQGALPKHLAKKCKIPVCSSCLYAKMSKKPWQHKPFSHTKKVRQLQPG